ncbi:MAG: SHOCT domain-containing protein, partial [Candidatus Poseidoniia archaeon]|nr:SHOCT domain-containing protein [Candidatus Poseidoniia archaeon]
DRLMTKKNVKKEKQEIKKKRKGLIIKARDKEDHLDYEGALKIWEYIGSKKEAKRLRQKIIDGKKVEQTVVHGDYVDDRDTTYIDDRDTIIKDSVVSKSNVGAGSSKMRELKELTEMKEKGLIDDDEFKQMKKEILGK